MDSTQLTFNEGLELAKKYNMGVLYTLEVIRGSTPYEALEYLNIE